MLNTVAETAMDPVCLSHRQTFDIEEHASGLRGWQLQYNQLTAGRFAGSLTEVWLDGMQLVRDRANQAMVKNGMAWQEAAVFSLPLAAADSHFYWAGHAIDELSVLAVTSGDLPEVRTSGDLDLLNVAVERSKLEQVLEQQQRKLGRGLVPGCYRLTNVACRDELSVLASGIMDERHPQGQAIMAHAPIRAGIRDTVLMLVLDAIDCEDVRFVDPHARKRIVDRARDYVLAHRDDPPSIVDVCNKVGASRRKLQYCFQETLGINPVAYLRALRLNAAHRDLYKGSNDVSVQDVAARWGFWHLSRFANDYRALFGERPSETLRRATTDFADIG